MDHVSDKPTTARVMRDVFLWVDSPAEEFIECMENVKEKEPIRALHLAVAAIRLDPGCIEAHLLLSDHAKTDELSLRHLRKAVESGEQLWGELAIEYGDDMTWWGFSATRPYMRAIQALGDLHVELGNLVAARECYSKLMDMNPRDNQGIRFSLERLEQTEQTPSRRPGR